MTLKTLQDCAKCPNVSRCTAHITGGSWHYDKGADPCQLVQDDKDRGCPE